MSESPAPLLVPAAYAVVVDHLRRAIHLGTYAPGEKLPPEREHAELLGVSRVTLREALRVLEGEGYLEMRRGSAGGAIILGPPASGALGRAQLREHLDEILAIQEFRAAIEPLSAARAAERSTPRLVKALRASVADIGEATSLGLFRRADTTFHLTLADAADCPPLRRSIEDARIAMFDQLDVVDFDIIVASALEGHGAITEAVADGDPAAARVAMEAHVAGLRTEIIDLLGPPRRRRSKGS